MGSCAESKSESSRSGSQLHLFQGQSGVLCGGCLKQGGQLPSKQVEEPPRDWVLGPVRVDCSRAKRNRLSGVATKVGEEEGGQPC